jgi:5-methyltetrahydropteroyltriglutamate--homocysteine methyltransferase
MNSLDTTVVGSFPVLPFYPVKQDFPPYTDVVPEGEIVVDDPFIPGVFEALRMQCRTGVDYPSYGQPQEMCSMFLGHLLNHGLIPAGKGFEVVGDLEVPRGYPGIEYLQIARKFFPVKGVKMPVTGPLTLAAAVKVGDTPAIGYPEVVENLAKFAAHIARGYDEGGASLISVDEPSLVYALYVGLEPEFCIEMVNKSLEGIRNAVPSIHVCGEMNTNITDIALSTKARILDHEFAAIPKNLDMYNKEDLESCGKVLGYGCVETNVEPNSLIQIQKDGLWQRVVEPVTVIEKRILKAVGRWGEENIIIDPDCGFGGMKGYIRGHLTEDVALRICEEKLRNMVEATRTVKEATA